MSLRRLFEYLTPYATTATSPASHQTTFEKYELAYQYMRFWRTFLYQHVCRCTHNVEHDSDIFYDAKCVLSAVVLAMRRLLSIFDHKTSTAQ